MAQSRPLQKPARGRRPKCGPTASTPETNKPEGIIWLLPAPSPLPRPPRQVV